MGLRPDNDVMATEVEPSYRDAMVCGDCGARLVVINRSSRLEYHCPKETLDDRRLVANELHLLVVYCGHRKQATQT